MFGRFLHGQSGHCLNVKRCAQGSRILMSMEVSPVPPVQWAVRSSVEWSIQLRDLCQEGTYGGGSEGLSSLCGLWNGLLSILCRNQTECRPCPSGSPIKNQIGGSIECLQCLTGTWNPSTGQTVCVLLSPVA